MFSTGVFCVATKNHIKGGSGSFETPPLWENRRQKTATQINYKLSHVERDPGYVLLFIRAARAAVEAAFAKGTTFANRVAFGLMHNIDESRGQKRLE